MEDKPLNENRFGVSVEILKELVNKYMQREHGSDDIDYLEENGGLPWLQTGIQTSPEKGIKTDSIESREKYFGSNRKQKVIIKSFWQLAWMAFDDLILRILVVAGIASIIINMITEEHNFNISLLTWEKTIC